MQIIFTSSILFFGFLGFIISNYIYRNKKKNKKVICPNKSKCDRVVYSSYSKFFGLPIEKIGVLYYLFIVLSFGLIFVLNVHDYTINLILLGVSSCSLLFSIYLTLIQIFIIKKLCAWCIVSSITTFCLFILIYFYIILL